MYYDDKIRRNCRLVASDNGLTIYEFKPTLFNLQTVPIEPLSKARRFRLALEIIRGGYTDYYLVLDNIVVGNCIITPGGRRLKCSNKDDGVIGPLFICPEYRGKGLSEILVRQVLICCSQKFSSFYCWIYENNIPSRRSLEACGFKPVGRLDVVGKFRRLIISPHGADIIYKRDNAICQL